MKKQTGLRLLFSTLVLYAAQVACSAPPVPSDQEEPESAVFHDSEFNDWMIQAPIVRENPRLFPELLNVLQNRTGVDIYSSNCSSQMLCDNNQNLYRIWVLDSVDELVLDFCVNLDDTGLLCNGYSGSLKSSVELSQDTIDRLVGELEELPSTPMVLGGEPVQVQEPTPEATPTSPAYNPEINMKISGALLRDFRTRYASIRNLIENRTGRDWLQRDCGGDTCFSLGDIARIELIDSGLQNRVKVDLYRNGCGGDCELLEGYYDIKVSESEMDNLVQEISDAFNVFGGYSSQTLFTSRGDLGRVLDQRGGDYEGLADLIMQAKNPGLESSRIIELLQESYEFVMVPTSYCDINTGDPMIVIVPPGEDPDAQQFRVSEALYEQILNYVVGG